MTEETKELINYIRVNLRHNKCFGGVNLDEEDCKLLLDYITNLQQENETLKEELKNRPIVDFTFDVYKELEELQQRIEKANQIIMKQKTKMYKSKNKIAMYILMKLEKVLKGSNEE